MGRDVAGYREVIVRAGGIERRSVVVCELKESFSLFGGRHNLPLVLGGYKGVAVLSSLGAGDAGAAAVIRKGKHGRGRDNHGERKAR